MMRRRRMCLWIGMLVVGLGVRLSLGGSPCVFTPWGTLSGMRVHGVPVEFDAGLRWVHPEWRGFSGAVKYLQRPRYVRSGPVAVVESSIEGIDFRQELRETGLGSATLQVAVHSRTNLALAGAYYCIDLPDSTFAGGTLSFIKTNQGWPGSLSVALTTGGDRSWVFLEVARGFRVASGGRTLEVHWDQDRNVQLRREASDRPTSINDPSVRQRWVSKEEGPEPSGYQMYVELFEGDAVPGRESKAEFRWQVEAGGEVEPVEMRVDITQRGRAFEGVGGNFRRQFPETDSSVIRYLLDHLPVAWGRVDLPWAEWHPEEGVDPMEAARAGRLHPRFGEAMETARGLVGRGIPVMFSAWSPPRWAQAASQPPGLRGVALDGAKLGRIGESLAGALGYLKDHAGVEVAYFSFNEPETGVEVRQTKEEHAAFLGVMGRALAKRGLSTRLLLGDTAHGTLAALDYVRPAMADARLHRYIGALAFHTWRGCTASDLRAWSDAAQRLGVPLMVTEAGPDAHLHHYPGVRLEPWFQLQEIELYVRCAAHAQPAMMLHWQLTSDYSVLTGGGVYGEPGPLRPTQRFWNLQQLGLTPSGSLALPMTSDQVEVTCAAFGHEASGTYTVHLVNRGGSRTARLSGFPAGLTRWRQFLTDAERGRVEQGVVEVRGGQAEWMLPSASFTTLLGR